MIKCSSFKVIVEFQNLFPRDLKDGKEINLPLFAALLLPGCLHTGYWKQLLCVGRKGSIIRGETEWDWVCPRKYFLYSSLFAFFRDTLESISIFLKINYPQLFYFMVYSITELPHGDSASPHSCPCHQRGTGQQGVQQCISSLKTCTTPPSFKAFQCFYRHYVGLEVTTTALIFPF